MPSVEISHDIDLGPEISDELNEIAIKQGENPDLKCAIIEEFRDMIFERGNCTPHRTDNEFLIKFLRGRFWKVEASYKLLCNYCEFRDANRELHEKVHPIDLKPVGDYDIVSVAPYKDQDGHRILFYRFGNWKPAKTSVNDIFKVTLILLEIGALEPSGQILGGVGIFDLSNLTLNHSFHLTPSVAQKMISLMVTSMPIRTTAIHIVNQNWVFTAAFNIFKPFLNARMRERIFIHGSDMSSLHKHIKPEHLPKRYGGIHEDYAYSIWIEKLMHNEKIIKEMETLGYVVEPKDFVLVEELLKNAETL